MRTLILGTLPAYFNALFIILVGILITQWQGAEVYGKVAFIIAIAKLVSYLFEYGLAKVSLQIIPKYVYRNHLGKIKGFLYAGFLIVFTLSIFLSVTSYIIYKLIAPILTDIHLNDFSLLLGIAFVIASTRFLTCSLQGKGLFILGAIIGKLESPILWLFMLLLTKKLNLFELNADKILHLYLFSLFVGLLIAIYFVIYKFSNKIWRSSYQFEWKDWIKLGSAYTINSFSLVLTNQIGIIVLGTISKDVALVGVYAALTNIVTFFHLTLTSSNSYYLPTLSHAHTESNTHLFNKTLAHRCRYLGLSVIGYLSLLLIFGNAILSLYGELFSQFYLALLLLAVVYAIETILGTSVNVIVIYGHQVRAALTQFITATSAVILTFLFVPSLTIYGAIIGYAIAKIFSGVFNSIWVYFRHKVNMVRF